MQNIRPGNYETQLPQSVADGILASTPEISPSNPAASAGASPWTEKASVATVAALRLLAEHITMDMRTVDALAKAVIYYATSLAVDDGVNVFRPGDVAVDAPGRWIVWGDFQTHLIEDHIADVSNPHHVTAAQTGAYTSGATDILLAGKSDTGHNHNGVYSLVAHNHDLTYAALAHTHDDRYYTESETNNLLSGKAAIVAAPTAGHFASLTAGGDLADSGSKAADFAAVGHNHDLTYAALGHNHDLAYAALGHNHDLAYSAIGHNHDLTYAALAHTHTAYASKVGSPTTGNFASLTAGGDLADSGSKAGDFATAGHNHDLVYSALGHNHDLAYAAIGHNHSGVYSVVGHDHAGVYSVVGHDHAGVYQPVLGYTAENTANKGAVNGYAPLGADSKVPSANLPTLGETGWTYVASLAELKAAFPNTFATYTACTMQDVGNTITKATHGLGVGRSVWFDTSAGGVTAGTQYYVRAVPTPDTFTLMATMGGAEFNITADANNNYIADYASYTTGDGPRGTYGSAVGAKIKLTADISGLDVVLNLLNTKIFDLNGHKITCAAGGSVICTRLQRENNGSFAAATPSWSESGLVFTMTGTSTYFNNMSVTAGATAAVIALSSGSVVYSFRVKTIDSATQLTMRDNPVAYLAAATVNNGSWWMDKVNDGLIVRNGIIDYDSKFTTVANFACANAVFDNVKFLNFGDGTTATAFFRAGHLAAECRFIGCEWRNFNSSGQVQGIDCSYSRGIEFTNCDVKNVVGNTAGANNYGILFGNSITCALIGGKLEHVNNAGNGTTYGIWTNSDGGRHRISVVEVCRVKKNGGGAIGIYSSGTKDTVSGCTIQGCDTNTVTCNGGTKSGNQEG